MAIGNGVKSESPIRRRVPVGNNLYFDYDASSDRVETPSQPRSPTPDQPLMIASVPTATVDEVGDYIPFKQSRLKGQVNPLRPPLEVETVLIGRALGQHTDYLFGVGFRVLGDGRVEAEFVDGVQEFDSYKNFENDVTKMLTTSAGARC